MRKTVTASIVPVWVIGEDSSLRKRLCVTLERGGYPVIVQDKIETEKPPASWPVSGIVFSTLGRQGPSAKEFHAWLSESRSDLASRVLFLAGKSLPKGSHTFSAPPRFYPKEFLSAVLKTIGKAPNTERILVVDDDEPIREIMSFMLSLSGYRCRTVNGGVKALRLLDAGGRFDLVTTDICNFPIDGPGFLEQLKHKFPEIPVLMISAVHDISIALACMRSGAYDYLLKPFELEQLIFTVRRALESVRLKPRTVH
jgi:CheY-like chemotaxis protein